MPDNLDWKRLDAERQFACKQGEEISYGYGFHTPPVDPLSIVEEERRLVHAVGGDFGNTFDGRIKYVGPRFLLCYNTRYNAWPHTVSVAAGAGAIIAARGSRVSGCAMGRGMERRVAGTV